MKKGDSRQVYVSNLDETPHRERLTLKRHGQQCILSCREAAKPNNDSSNAPNKQDYLENLFTVAELYIQGYALEYDQMFCGNGYSKIPLPTYPFARDSYWIEKPKKALYHIQIQNRVRLEPELGEAVALSEKPLKCDLKEMISVLLKIPAEKLHDKSELVRYGFDSIHMFNLINRIQSRYSLKLSPKVLYECNTIDRLSIYIMQKLKSSADKNNEPLSVSEKLTSSVENTCFPLSEGQKGLWLIQQMHPESCAYNVPLAFRINGELDIALLREALDDIVQLNPAFRTRFTMEGQTPVQITDVNPGYSFTAENVNNLLDCEIEAYLKARSRIPFDLASGPLMRVNIVSLSDQKHILLITVHHIVFDGSSLMIFLRELSQRYSAKKKGTEVNLESTKASYAEYVRWQSAMLDSDVGRSYRAFWRKRLSGVSMPVLPFGETRSKKNGQAGSGETYRTAISEQRTNDIENYCCKEGISPYILMLSAFNVLLYRYTGQNDIVVGTPYNGRSRLEFEEVIGYFINMVLIRSCVSGESSVQELLKQVQSDVYESLEYGNFPFSEIVQDKSATWNRGSTSLIPVVFVFQNWLKLERFDSAAQGPGSEGGLTLEHIHTIHQEGEFGLSFEIVKAESVYRLLIKYYTEFLNQDIVKRMSVHYIEIIDAIVKGTAEKVAQIEIRTVDERKALKRLFLKEEYPVHKTIQQLFEEQVERTPDNIAVLFKDGSISYAELNAQSNSLGRYLRKRGVKGNAIVGIMADRSLQLMVGLMGILKAGGAYLPIDPNYPKSRISYLLKDSGAEILLVNHNSTEGIDFEGHVIEIDDPNIYVKNSANLERINKTTDLAYVIYTSGSTGNPKGVMIEHRSLVNRLKWMQKIQPLDHKDTVLQKTPYTFDVSVWELFWWALEGAKLCLLEPGCEKDPHHVIKTIEAHSITVTHFVPSMLQGFLEYVKEASRADHLVSLKRVFASGEALTR